MFMANGIQKAEENLRRFEAWKAAKSDDDFMLIVRRGILNRSAIVKECRFSRAVLNQNPKVKKALKKLEDALRDRGVLPLDVASKLGAGEEYSPLNSKSSAEKCRLLELENTTLRRENIELKRMLSKFEILKEALVLTGRVPR